MTTLRYHENPRAQRRVVINDEGDRWMELLSHETSQSTDYFRYRSPLYTTGNGEIFLLHELVKLYDVTTVSFVNEPSTRSPAGSLRVANAQPQHHDQVVRSEETTC